MTFASFCWAALVVLVLVPVLERAVKTLQEGEG